MKLLRSARSHRTAWPRLPREVLALLSVAAGLVTTVQAQPRAYVLADRQAKVIDTATNTVVAAVFFSNVAGLVDIAVSSDGTRAYVTDAEFVGEVFVIDTATNAVVARVGVGGLPFFLAVKPDGSRVYVTDPRVGRVSVIDTATNAVVARVPIPGLAGPIAVTPDGTRAYVTNSGSEVSVIDTATNAVAAAVTFGPASPLDVAVMPVGTRAYVALSDNAVAVLDTATNTVVATIPFGAVTRILAFTPDGARAFATTGSTNAVAVIDTATNAVVATVPVGGFPSDIAVTPDGTRAYVTNATNAVSVIDTATNAVVATVPVGAPSGSIAITAAPSLTSADLSLTQTVASEPINDGALLTYTLTLTNHGPSPAQSVRLTDSFPEGIEGVIPQSCGATGGGSCLIGTSTVTVSFASLAPGASAAITLVFGVTHRAVIRNQAAVISATPDPDLGNNSASVTSTISPAPPMITGAAATPAVLWPPNHQMVDVTVDYAAAGNSGPPACALSVTSNEPADGQGDGRTEPDWEVVDEHHVRLRAERAGNGGGRVYTVTITCQDGAGGTSSQVVEVRVPKSIGTTSPIVTRLAPGMVMDAIGAGRSNGTPVRLWARHDGANQQFAWQPNGEIRVYGDMCLDAAGGQGRDGDRLILWSCHGGANQRWTATAVGEIRGINGKCIDVFQSGTSNGTELILWPCHGGLNQKWDIPDAGGTAPPPVPAGVPIPPR